MAGGEKKGWMGGLVVVSVIAVAAAWGTNQLLVVGLDRSTPDPPPKRARPSAAPSSPSVAEVPSVDRESQPALETLEPKGDGSSPAEQQSTDETGSGSAGGGPGGKRTAKTSEHTESTSSTPVFTIERSSLERQFDDPEKLGRQGQILPNYKAGQRYGMRIVNVAPDGIYARLGIQSGDVIVSVNDKAITTQQKAVSDIEAMRGQKRFVVEIERDGRLRRQIYRLE